MVLFVEIKLSPAPTSVSNYINNLSLAQSKLKKAQINFPLDGYFSVSLGLEWKQFALSRIR